jgi:hypothetical protein
MLRGTWESSTDSLQCPYDTGRPAGAIKKKKKKKKKGRKVQLAETCGITKKSGLEPGLNLLLHVSVGGAHVSDLHGVEPLIACL